ncbi:MAG: hypothetical protein IKG98_05745 [Ruminococcus sp.]|nr:hypothetical protein [Ruminococcus sp.]
MAITGSGTQADPFIIHDWDEFVQAVQTSNSYSVLANDIVAPSSNVNLDMRNMTQLDGQGYAIIGLICTSGNCLQPTNFNTPNKTIKNIKFKNIHMDGGDVFLYTDLGNYKSVTLKNVSFSGMFESGMLTNDSAGSYTYSYTADGVGINIEVYNSNFRLMGLGSSRSMSGAFANVNGIIRYIGCSPSASLFDKSSGRKTLKKSTLRIEIPSDGAKLDIGATLNAVDIYGSGAGIIIDSASGVCVVEDTLTLETALANVYSVSTSVIKDPQALRDDYGFPIGVD